MPFIHLRAYSGRDEETKKKAAQAIVEAASAAMNTPLSAFTFAFEDIDKDAWEADVEKAVIEPLKDKIFIKRGEPV